MSWPGPSTAGSCSTHPFYQRWEAGLLSAGELAEYAVHYRAFEAALPAVLTAVVDRLQAEGDVRGRRTGGREPGRRAGSPRAPPGPVRPLRRIGLADESRIDGPAAAPGPAADALVRTYFDLVAEGPAAALAGLAAYETQASAIASSKAEGLRRWYGMDAAGTEFWDVHAAMDADHGEWAVAALALLDADPDQVARSARRGRRRLVGAARRARGRGPRLSRALCPPLRRTTPSRRGSRPGCG